MTDTTNTFLFTDIEASTRLWEEHPTAMPDALERHDRVVTAAITSHHGQVLKSTGDGVIARFHGVEDAVAAAVAAQRSLSAESWSATGPLRSRMGIHTGDAEARGDDFFGPTMNRTARIMAAGHGGQVLLSAVAASAVDGGLPTGVGLQDMGEHRLKDLTFPEHLYQVTIEGLPSVFASLRTLDSRPHNLPVQASEFMGREEELSGIQTMLAAPGTRLLTLGGPGGIGKTRLSLQIAAESLDQYRDGVFFVDLSAERDPSAAFEAVVRALNLPTSGSGDSLQVLKMRLRDKQMLLVLDNLEQVTEVGPGLAELLQHAPELDILVTSRETLRVRAERVFPVPPMTLPRPDDATEAIAEAEAVQLFTERARSVRPDFTITAENAPTVAEICLRLDGLPLAIELAAARLNVFSVTDLLQRLQQRLDILSAGGRDLPDRQRTLWGAIGWSYELLDEDERRLLEVASVFSSASFDALEVVAGQALDLDRMVLDVVSSLLDKSLIRTYDEGSSQRFTMLLMIKEFAWERLAEDTHRNGAVREAHARHYSSFVTNLEARLKGTDAQKAIDELAVEIGNLRTAWSYWVERKDLDQLLGLLDGLWALHESKGWYHAAIGLINDTLGVLEESEARESLAEEELALRSSLARAMMAVHGYGEEVEAAFIPVLELVRSVGTSAQTFSVLRSLASYYMSTIDFESAVDVGHELMTLAETENSDSIRAEAYYLLGSAMAFSGDETGIPNLDKAIALYRTDMHTMHRLRVGPNTAITARVAWGLLVYERGHMDQATARLTEALAIARELEHPFTLAHALYHNGYLSFLRSRFEDTLAHAHELARVSDENDYIVWRTLATVLEGAALVGLGRSDEGLEMTEAGVSLYRGLTTPPVFWPFILGLRAQVHLLAGQGSVALELARDALAVDPEAPEGAQFWVIIADVLRHSPDAAPADIEDAYQHALTGARQIGARLVELLAWTGLVQFRRRAGISPDGSEELSRLYSTFDEGLDESAMLEAKRVLG
ncbi:MAG TPA: adenylate/guanylate cyclase domain-containing protein [Acidimicrobiia bacterium]|nr:adenylate/guanylate cyclase domain-containing protein [Acidimicrobiia bacterium]